MSLSDPGLLLTMASLIASPTVGDEVVITHAPAACMVAGKFPQLEARIDPSAQLRSVRVYFHTRGARFWSYTEMTPDKGTFRATLPKPARSAKEVYYYIVATDASAATTRTPEYLAEVVEAPGQCRDPQRVAKALDSASPVIGRGEPIPVVHAASAGLSGKTVGLAALGAAAVGAGVIAATHGGGGGSPGSTTGTFAGTLDGYFQSESGACPWDLNVLPGGTISISISSSGASASFTFPPGAFDLRSADPACTPPPPIPATNAQFSQVTASGNSVSGRAVVGFQTFVLHAAINGSSLGGAIDITGGPPGTQWSPATATIHGNRAP
jgi:hypothetical protein